MHIILGIVVNKIDLRTISITYKQKKYNNKLQKPRVHIKKILADDPLNLTIKGSLVMIKKCAPVSKLKHFVVEKVLSL